jgi:hypothetical protein
LCGSISLTELSAIKDTILIFSPLKREPESFLLATFHTQVLRFSTSPCNADLNVFALHKPLLFTNIYKPNITAPALMLRNNLYEYTPAVTTSAAEDAAVADKLVISIWLSVVIEDGKKFDVVENLDTASVDDRVSHTSLVVTSGDGSLLAAVLAALDMVEKLGSTDCVKVPFVANGKLIVVGVVAASLEMLWTESSGAVVRFE